MSFTFVKQLPSPDQIKAQTPYVRRNEKNKSRERPPDPGCDHWKI